MATKNLNTVYKNEMIRLQKGELDARGALLEKAMHMLCYVDAHMNER